MASTTPNAGRIYFENPYMFKASRKLRMFCVITEGTLFSSTMVKVTGKKVEIIIEQFMKTVYFTR